MQSMLQILPINAFKDNYIWAMVNQEKKSVWVVDPGDAEPVIAFLRKHSLNLKGILITHHHSDHCGGVKELQEKYQIIVYGPKHSDILATDIVKDKQQITLQELDLTFEAIAIPGHTLEHTAYYSKEAGLLFSGDTLFSAGCGRVFEGTHEQMYNSLQKLANLPEETKVYCGHEYTLANLRFAQTVEKENPAIQQQIKIAEQCRDNDKPTLPSTLGLEKQINPFLRAKVPEVIAAATGHAQKPLNTPVSVFTEIREWKNSF